MDKKEKNNIQDKVKSFDENLENLTKNKTWFSATKNALNGIIEAFKTERNLRIDYIIGVLVFCTSFFFDFTKTEFATLCLTIGFVLFAEMINTTVEYMVDLITDKYDDRAKSAKDIAAGGVLLASIVAVLNAYFLFIDKIHDASTDLLEKVLNSHMHMLVAILFIVVLFVVILKGIFSKGRNYVASFPSARIVISYGLATFLLILTQNLLVGAVSFVLCFMISQLKRENDRISTSQVILSALLGILLVLIVYQITLINPVLTDLLK